MIENLKIKKYCDGVNYIYYCNYDLPTLFEKRIYNFSCSSIIPLSDCEIKNIIIEHHLINIEL